MSVSGVCAVVPAFREAPRIERTVRALLSVDGITDVVVVDDCSDDETAAVAAAAGARTLSMRRRSGKGAALRVGVSETDGPWLVFVDGDLGDSASCAADLLAPVRRGDADMTVAAPPRSGPSGFGIVERFSRWGIRRTAAFDAARPLSGQRALVRAVVERCRIADGFGVETALTIDAIRAGFRVIEVPCDLTHRRTGRDPAGFAHRARQGWDVAKVLAPRLVRSAG